VEPTLDLAPKLKPNHAYGRIVEPLGFGRYSVLLQGATRPVPKERRDLVSKVKEDSQETDETAADRPRLPLAEQPVVGQISAVLEGSLIPPAEGQPAVARGPRRNRRLVVDRLRAEGFAALSQPLLEYHHDEDPPVSL
jgi:hypothetical protein